MATPAFSGSVPQLYHTLLGPLLFHGYADDMAARLDVDAGQQVLELAAGTGIVSSRIRDRLPPDGRLVVTDLSQAMLDVAKRTVGEDPRLEFLACDACDLPFPDASFDRMACQFGVMFFPDKERAMREARRVLRPGGVYVFNVWDSLAGSPIPEVVERTVARQFPQNPPGFLGRLPYGYFDTREMERVVRSGGFKDVRIETLELPSVAPTAEDAARAFMEGTPLSAEIAALNVPDLAALRAIVTKALAERFGDRPCRSTMRAFVATAR